MILHTLDKNTTPEAYVTQRLKGLQQSPDKPFADIFAVQFMHSAHYLIGQPDQELLALVQIHESPSAFPAVNVSIFPYTYERTCELEMLPAELESVTRYCTQQGFPWVLISSPLLLEPVYVPKPWGQEVWYTGVEARGQASVVGQGGSLPLPWVMEFLRHRLALVDSEQLILLKVLDPLADEGYGDLYFELHEQKQEVYVVTHVDSCAWPDGRGAIQLGFDRAVRDHYETNDAFKAAYCAAVSAYEQTRRAIDCLLDQKKQEQGLALTQPVTANNLKLWINDLSQLSEYKSLISREKELKRAMNSFVAQHSLVVGDVVTVPRLVPHALQHGVRVVEFQTPVYERKILSFGQKVLTQEHWDTAEALTLVDMDSETLVASALLLENDVIQIQRIVNFDEFEVRRIKLRGAHRIEFECYCLLMVLEGEVSIDVDGSSIRLITGDVTLIPANEHLPNWLNSSEACLLLQAIPKLV